MSTMDIEMFDILVGSGCPVSAMRNFAGLSKGDLNKLPFEELVTRLESLLPPDDSRNELVVDKIIAALRRRSGNGEGASRSKMDMKMLDILIQSDCRCSGMRNFAGLKKGDLDKLPFEELVTRLESLLPPVESTNGLVVDKIIEALRQRSGNGGRKSFDRARVKREVKKGQADSSTQPVNVGQVEVSEQGQTPRVEEQQEQNGNLEKERVQNDQEQEDPVQDDQIEQNQVAYENTTDEEIDVKFEIPQDHNADECDEDISILYENIEVSITDEIDATSKIQTPAEIVIADDDDDMDGLRQSSSCDAQDSDPINLNENGNKPNLGSYGLKHCTLGRRPRANSSLPVEWSRKQWDSFICESHKWATLTILSNTSMSSSPSDECKTTFPNLTFMKIVHRVKPLNEDDEQMSSHDINYAPQLFTIITGAKNLTRIEFSYQDELALNTFLNILQTIDKSHLASLKILSISRNDDEFDVALVPSELNLISNIKAENLKELYLATCLWEDANQEFEAVLKNFRKLTHLIITGCFVGPTQPKICITFPKMSHLQVLKLGQNFKFASTLETIEEPPKKKRRKTNFDPNAPQRQSPRGNANSRKISRISTDQDQNEIDESCAGEYFCVGVEFGVDNMQSLKTLILGPKYDIQYLRFKNFPSLEIFRVASPWDSCIPQCFSSRKGFMEFSSLKELQFPDSYQDFSMVADIMIHFPSIEKVHINLPTVNFLRAFAATMRQEKFKSFQRLWVTTQFDFPSSINSCILDKKSIASPQEKALIKILKNYPHWKDYVTENQIVLPEEVNTSEESSKFCGLWVLFSKLKFFEIRHIPRSLRIPMGTRHWIDDQDCQFTTTLLGYKEYPMTNEAWGKRPETMTWVALDFNMDEVKKKGVKISSYFHNGEIPLDPTTPMSKKEEPSRRRLEPQQPSTSTSTTLAITSG